MTFEKENQINFFNLIFLPRWLYFLDPPFLFLTLLVNLAIDCLVIYVVLYVNKIYLEKRKIIKRVFQAWGFGLLADFCAFLLLALLFKGRIGDFYAWRNPLSTVKIVFTIASTGLLIFIFNYSIFLRDGISKKDCLKIGLSMGLITAPWLFLLPDTFSQWFKF